MSGGESLRRAYRGLNCASRWSGIVISGASAVLTLDFGVVNGEDGAEFVGVERSDIDLLSGIRDPASEPSRSSGRWSRFSEDLSEAVFSRNA